MEKLNDLNVKAESVKEWSNQHEIHIKNIEFLESGSMIVILHRGESLLENEITELKKIVPDFLIDVWQESLEIVVF